jgi:hypothetical protein
MILKKILILFTVALFFAHQKSDGQSYWFGLKGGAGMNFQSWGDGSSGGSINRDPLFSPNGDIFIESFDASNKGALYAQLGYHVRGSSVRFNSFNNIFSTQQGFKFNNIVVEIGAKKSFGLDKEFDPYFILGIRGEYTVSTNLDDYLMFGSVYYPVNDYVRKLNYGVTVGGGFEMKLSEMSNVFIEFSIQPDISLQYQQPPLQNVIEPFTGQVVNLGLRQVRNLSLELKVGARFLRKVEYVD